MSVKCVTDIRALSICKCDCNIQLFIKVARADISTHTLCQNLSNGQAKTGWIAAGFHGIESVKFFQFQIPILVTYASDK